jgi:hypothetical protein
LRGVGDQVIYKADGAALHILDLWGTACWVGVGSTIQFDLTEHLYKLVRGTRSEPPRVRWRLLVGVKRPD